MNDSFSSRKSPWQRPSRTRKNLERQMNEHLTLGPDWENKARLLSSPQEDLARNAHSKAGIRQYPPSTGPAGAQHEAVEKLKTALRQLQQKIEEAQRKKNLLMRGRNEPRRKKRYRRPWAAFQIPRRSRPSIECRKWR
jgi:phage shock protein A